MCDWSVKHCQEVMNKLQLRMKIVFLISFITCSNLTRKSNDEKKIKHQNIVNSVNNSHSESDISTFKRWNVYTKVLLVKCLGDLKAPNEPIKIEINVFQMKQTNKNIHRFWVISLPKNKLGKQTISSFKTCLCSVCQHLPVWMVIIQHLSCTISYNKKVFH